MTVNAQCVDTAYIEKKEERKTIYISFSFGFLGAPRHMYTHFGLTIAIPWIAITVLSSSKGSGSHGIPRKSTLIITTVIMI